MEFATSPILQSRGKARNEPVGRQMTGTELKTMLNGPRHKDAGPYNHRCFCS